MTGSGIPISQSRAPLPKPMLPSSKSGGHDRPCFKNATIRVEFRDEPLKLHGPLRKTAALNLMAVRRQIESFEIACAASNQFGSCHPRESARAQ